MKSENNIIYISIGGVEYPIRVLYKDVEGFLKGFNKILLKNKGKSGLKIPNEFFFTVLWKCLVKQGYLLWRKPFICKRSMVNNILFDEVSGITLFISKHILKFEDDAIDPKSKKKQTVQ